VEGFKGEAKEGSKDELVGLGFSVKMAPAKGRGNKRKSGSKKMDTHLEVNKRLG